MRPGGKQLEEAKQPDLLALEIIMTPDRAKPESGPTPTQCEIRIELAPDATRQSLIAGGVRLLLDFAGSVAPGLAFRLRPERKLLGPIGHRADLELGDIGPGQHHALLFKLRAPSHPVGELAVARLEVQYHASGLGDWRQEVRIVLPFGAPPPAPSKAAKPKRPPALKKTDAQLVDDFRGAYRDGRLHHSLEAIQTLLERSETPDRTEDLEAILLQARQSGRLTEEAHATVVGVKEEGETYDVLLLEVGERHIKVARLMREVTGLSLRDVTELLKQEQPVIGRAIRFAQAVAFKRSLESAGATVELRRCT